MSISFNNIPSTLRTPGVFAEVDNSRALKGLFPNPHKVLILGQKISTGEVPIETIYNIVTEQIGDNYFGANSPLARMCKTFKKNNPNTDVYAVALSGGTAQASARIHFSMALSHAGFSCSSGNQYLYLLINGQKAYLNLTSGWSMVDIASGLKTYISEAKTFPVTASRVAASGVLVLSALHSGTTGNYLDVRVNYYDGQSLPTFFGDSVLVSGFAGGTGDPDLGDAWPVIENETFQYIVSPYIDSSNLTELETELADRFTAMKDKQGQGFAVVRGTLASCTTLGNSRNSPHVCLMGMYDSPTDPAEWSAAYGAQAAEKLNDDPGRPLQYLELKGVLAPPSTNRFTQTERNNLLYDGIATFIVDVNGKVLIERSITTYQTNSLGISDVSYLDVETLAILNEIRYQFKARMLTRFVYPRFKLADDTFPVQPGTNVVTPKTIKQEIISLFSLLQEKGLIENLDDFIKNLIVERSEDDVNRVDVLLPPDLINQFRVLAGLVQFIL